MLDAYPTRSSEPEAVLQHVRILGTGAADPTEQIGAGVTATWIEAGKYRVTFADSPGTFVDCGYMFQAATPSALAGYTAIADTWDSTNLRFDVWVYDSTFTLADLAADQYLNLQIWFKRTGV